MHQWDQPGGKSVAPTYRVARVNVGLGELQVKYVVTVAVAVDVTKKREKQVRARKKKTLEEGLEKICAGFLALRVWCAVGTETSAEAGGRETVLVLGSFAVCWWCGWYIVVAIVLLLLSLSCFCVVLPQKQTMRLLVHAVSGVLVVIARRCRSRGSWYGPRHLLFYTFPLVDAVCTLQAVVDSEQARVVGTVIDEIVNLVRRARFNRFVPQAYLPLRNLPPPKVRPCLLHRPDFAGRTWYMGGRSVFCSKIVSDALLQAC